MSLKERVVREFVSRFRAQPTAVVRAPGRVNLIGEHTDYNDGFVLPMAIDRAVWIALQPSSGREINVQSLDFDETRTFTLEEIGEREGYREDGTWIKYVKGIAWAMQEAGYALRAWEGILVGDVPIGAGLSSSAALEIATARAFAHISELPWDPAAMAKLGQRAENEWVGLNCGIMDHMISAAGRAGHALLIDCRSLETQSVPLPTGTVTVVMDTATRRGLVDSAYNERQAQCEAAARFFDVPALRDVGLTDFEARIDELDALIRRRVRHVISENERTLRASQIMREGDVAKLGQLMNASHESLRNDFEVSSEALNIMVGCARRADGCYGARMTGAGFGGCAVALVQAKKADAFVKTVGADYEHATGNTPSLYICHATNGAEVL
jgi:galactokinase